MTTAAPEKHEFQAEAQQVLDLMVHSVYSNKDIFLRELISNASDALDKLRLETLKNPDLAQPADAHIRIEAIKSDRTITVHDNGIGMSRDEVRDFIGTIAKSGTKVFAEKLKAMKDAKQTLSAELIGQFGVGFYSSFMVADRVTLVTRKVGEETATRWESSGEGSYTLEDATRDGHGTSVTLHLKDEDEEDELHDYSQEWTIRGIVKKYSDFVTHPIRMKVERSEPQLDEDGKPKEGAEPKIVYEDDTLNSMKAIWARSSSEVTDDEYKEFYKHVSHDWNDPLLRISLRAEGTLEFAALLYIPATAPMDMFYREFKKGIQLYVRRVFIMDDCEELVPNYLRFIKGVVDSEDLSLNISREILQQNRQIRVMRKRIVRKVLDTLIELKKDEAEKFVGFWKEFGKVLKEGLFEDAGNREKLFEICLFESTRSADESTTLGDYVDRMKEDQEKIYYMTGESRIVIENSPHLEAFREKGLEVLIMPDPVDEVWLQTTQEFEGKKFESISKGAAELGTEEERKQAEEELKTKEEEVKDLLDALQKHLDEDVKEVRLSSRLTHSPVCLVGDVQDMSPQMEALMKQVGQEMPATKRILEINPKHELLDKLASVYKADADDARLGDFAQLLHGQALLAEGTPVKDPAKLAGLIADLMVKSL